MAVHVDRELCMGNGYCVRQASGAFKLDDDGIAAVIDPLNATEEQLRKAADGCPTGAIFLDEEPESLQEQIGPQ